MHRSAAAVVRAVAVLILTRIYREGIRNNGDISAEEKETGFVRSIPDAETVRVLRM